MAAEPAAPERRRDPRLVGLGLGLASALGIGLLLGLLGCGLPLAGPDGAAGGPGPSRGAGDDAGAAPVYRGRVGRDGRAFVGQDGAHFPWRGVAEHRLAACLLDVSRPAAEAEALVAGRMDLRARQGFSVLRVLGAAAPGPSPEAAGLRPLDDLPRYQQAMRRLFELARARGLYIEWVLLADLGDALPKERAGELVDAAAALAQGADNSLVVLAEEGWRQGLADEELLALGRRFKQGAPAVPLCAGAAKDEGRAFDAAPFDYVTIHGDRTDGDEGWRWVRQLGDGGIGRGDVARPVVLDRPLASAARAVPGESDSDGARFRAAALVSHATRQYFTFHDGCGLGASAAPDCAGAEGPGAWDIRRSVLISSDPRDGRAVSGDAADSPLGAAEALGGAVLRLYSKVLADGSGFFAYPLRVRQATQLRVRQPLAVTVLDAATGALRSSRAYAAGEALPLSAGEDVVLVGGRAKAPDPPPPPPPPPPMDPVPAQQAAADALVRGYSAAQAQLIVTRLYQAILGRDPDGGGLMGYAPQVAAGRLPRVTSALLTSAEFEGRRPGLSVQRLSKDLYQAILGRAPDEGGDQGTQAAIKAGLAAQRAADMVLSPEYEGGRL